MLHAVDADRHHGRAGKGTKEDPPEGVTHSDPEAGLEGLGHYAGVVIVTLRDLDLGDS